MNRSSNELDGTIGSFMKVHKREDGKFEATFPNDPQVQGAVAQNETEAVNRAKENMQTAVARGKAGKLG